MAVDVTATVTVLGVSADTWLGVVGVAATALAAWDARRQRSEREKAVVAAHKVIERSYGLLIGLKPGIAPLGKMHVDAMNDGLEAINQARAELAKL